MSTLSYGRHERLSLKNHAVFNEKWLQDRIAEDPSILGLGEIMVIDRERNQDRAGRLDLLLADADQSRRYEAELMLGATDEGHIIRCIEYWDIERRRFPAYEHCAVLVAEDITSRFLNVLAILAGTVPLIAIQLNALKFGDSILLDFVRVLDQRLLRRDDTAEAKLAVVDRSYWNDKASPKIVAALDELLAIVNEKADPKQHLNFNKYYVGLTDGVRSRTFITFRPRKQFVHILVDANDPQVWSEKCEEAGITADSNTDRLKLTIAPGDVKKHHELLAGILHDAVASRQG